MLSLLTFGQIIYARCSKQSFADEGRLEVEIWDSSRLEELVSWYRSWFAGYVSLLSPFDRLVNHVHSLPLDLWVSYGFLAMILFLVYVFAWLFVAMRSGIFKGCVFYKAWLMSFVLLMIFSITDLPYLDARINLVGWMLLAGIVSCAESSVLASSEKSYPNFD